MQTLITDAEFNALAGQAHINTIIYLYLRRYMNYTNGIVGLSRGVSYQSISEACYIEPRQGVKEVKYHISTLRRAIFQLEKTGLLERKNTPDNLVFFMPLAYTHYSARKKADMKPTGSRSEKTNKIKVLNNHADEVVCKADIHQLSGNTINKPPPPVISNLVEVKPVSVVVEFSKIIKPENQSAIQKQLEKVEPAMRQIMVDDLTGYIMHRNKTSIKVLNPVAVLVKNISRLKRGEYTPQQADDGAKLRAFEQAQLKIDFTQKAPAIKKPVNEEKINAFRDSLNKLTKTR